MAQFDVYDNPHPESRRFVPYLVDVQSALISQLTTRLVMPLSRVGAQQPKLPTNLCPVFDVGGVPQLCIVLFVVSASYLLGQNFNPFIYFRF